METTINSKKMEVSVTFATETATMQATVVVRDGHVQSVGGPVTNSDGQPIGYGGVNNMGQHTVTTDNGGKPSEIGALLEQAQQWVAENLAEAEQEPENEQ